jgi:hypothetical protein
MSGTQAINDFESLMTNKLILALLVILLSGIARAQSDCAISISTELIIPVRDHPEKFEVLLKTRRGAGNCTCLYRFEWPLLL